MAVMTKQDIEKLIRDVAGEQIAAFRAELEQVNRKHTAPGQVLGNIINGAEAKTEEKREPGTRFARYIRALGAAKGDPERAVKVAKAWGDEVLVKALGEATVADGGALVPPEFVQEVIELLRARAVVRASGAVSVPMNSNTLTLPKQTGSGTASYIGENTNIPPSQPTFGQIQLSAKKLAALTPISNDLIRDSSPQADTLVRDDLVAVMGLREDLAFLRDDGTSNKPKGVRYWVNASNVFAAGAVGTTDLEKVTYDLAKAVKLVEEANVPMTRMGWAFTPRTKWFLMGLRDGNGNLVFAPELRNGTLMGFPFKTSTQIPNNLGVGANESEIYLVDWSQAIIGENTQLLVDVFEGGAYWDGTQVVSGISSDQTVIRTIARHDFAMRHDKAGVVITGVTYGA